MLRLPVVDFSKEIGSLILLMFGKLVKLNSRATYMCLGSISYCLKD